MLSRKISPGSLVARISTLRRRHREINDRIDNEQLRTWPNADLLKQLKQERLGLRDAIRATKTTLMRAGVQPPYTT